MIGTLSSPPLAIASPAEKNDPKKVRAAAGDFEALLIGSLMKSMRETSSSGWLGTGEDKASESVMETAEQQLAQLLAAQGGLGLARLVSEGLSKPAAESGKTNPASGR